MLFRLSNGINWSFEIDANTDCELKKRVRTGCIEFKKMELRSKKIKSHNLELHFYRNGAWLNSNNSNFPPLISLKTYSSKETFSNLFRKSCFVGEGYDKICSISDYVIKEELRLI